jgi:hypothetical protein
MMSERRSRIQMQIRRRLLVGYDIEGRAPTSAEGEYFRSSVWRWRPLVELITALCPEETQACLGWLYNDGDGLDADGAKRLARRLETLLAEGAIDVYCREQNSKAEAVLDVARERHPQFDIRRSGTATSDDDGWIHLDRRVMLSIGNIPEGEEAFVKASIAALTVVRPALDEAFPVTQAEVEAFTRFATASGGFSIF